MQFIDPLNNGKAVLFESNFASNWKLFELIPFLITSALGGMALLGYLSSLFHWLIADCFVLFCWLLFIFPRPMWCSFHQTQPPTLSV